MPSTKDNRSDINGFWTITNQHKHLTCHIGRPLTIGPGTPPGARSETLRHVHVQRTRVTSSSQAERKEKVEAASGGRRPAASGSSSSSSSSSGIPYVTDARFRAAYRRAQARSGDSRPGVKTQVTLHGRKFNFQHRREPARASPTKNEEPQRRHTTALMARPPHGGHAHRGAAAKPPCAAKRTQAHIAPAATAAPAESPALGGPECPQGEIGPRARTSSARPTRDPPAARPRSAGPAGTGSSRARPKKIDPN